MSIKTELVKVTPVMARQLLEANTQNRALNMHHAGNLLGAMRRGEWMTTHQGIAIDEAGVILDGQHRLTALSLMDDRDFSIEMLVTSGLPRETFKVIDRGQKPRSTADVLGVSPITAYVANFFASLMLRQDGHPTAQQAEPFAEFFAAHVEQMSAFCGQTSRVWSSTAVRAATVWAMVRGNEAYALPIYRAFNLAKFDEMPPVAQSLYRQYLAGAVRGSGARDLFVRAVKVFDPANAMNQKVIVKDVGVVLDDVRRELAWRMGISPDAVPVTKKKAPAVGAKVVSVKRGQVYRAAAH